MEETLYKIVRMYSPSLYPHDTGIVGLTLEEAQEHCSREDTREEGKWFDGYTEWEGALDDSETEIEWQVSQYRPF